MSEDWPPASRGGSGPIQLKLIGVERIAGIDVARTQPSLEPAHPLIGGAVGEGIRHYITLGAALKAVIADLCCGIERLLDIALFENVPAVIGPLRPYPGIAVGLEFHPDRQGIALSL